MTAKTYTEEELHARITELIAKTPSLAGRILGYAGYLTGDGCRCCYVDYDAWTDEEISGWEEITFAANLLGYDL